MFKSPQNKYSLLFRKGDIFDMILRYSSTYDSINHYNATGFKINTTTNEDNEVTKTFELLIRPSIGYYCFSYKEDQIFLDYRISDSFVGTQFGATVLETLTISTNNNIQQFYDVVEDARKYCEPPKPEPKETF